MMDVFRSFFVSSQQTFELYTQAFEKSSEGRLTVAKVCFSQAGMKNVVDPASPRDRHANIIINASLLAVIFAVQRYVETRN